MSVVWLILKIIGITLLCILGLVLLILALILFVPIRYQIDGTAQSKEDYHAKVHVHWLLHAVSIKLGLDSPLMMSTRVRILGLFGKGKDSVKKLGKKGEDEDEDDSEDLDEELESGKDEDKPKESDKGKDKPKESDKDNDKDKSKEDKDSDKPPTGESAASVSGDAETHVKPPEDDKADGDEDKEKDNKKDRDKEKDEDKPSGEKDEDSGETDSSDDSGGDGDNAGDAEEAPKKRKLTEKIADLKETAACVLELFSRRKDVAVAYVKKDTTKAAIAKLWKAVLWLLKTIAPRKGHAELVFGMKDPQMTGNIFSAAATLYPWYGDHVTVIPDFEGEHLEGDGLIKGRIRLIGVLVWAIRLYFDKNLKRVFKEFKSVKEQMLSTPEDVKKIISKAA